ncbi:MAG TPA: thrombospondin type 3 repeat-containing protein [Dehalococcoidia bacterium]|nr:thrombospondin type 3 repeat-containing protein [Dehalococcoidia bacterium]
MQAFRLLVGALVVFGLAAAYSATGAPGDIERVSVDSSENPGNESSRNGEISYDGRFVVFSSEATNLVPGDTNTLEDVFLRDRLTGLTERVSVTSSEEQATQGYETTPPEGVVSDDGRFVAFRSDDWDLVPNDTNLRNDIFLRDRVAGTTVRISDGGTDPTMDATGSKVVFGSVAGVFLYETSSGTLSSLSMSGGDLRLSSDSNVLAFQLEGANAQHQVWVRDFAAGTTQRITNPAPGLPGTESNDDADHIQISGDGRIIAFDSKASDLVSGDTNTCRIYTGTGRCPDVFVHDRQTGVTTRVSVSSTGEQANEESRVTSITRDGRFVLFYSYASNLVPDDNDGVQDLFIHDLQTGKTALLRTGGPSGRISGNGQYLLLGTVEYSLPCTNCLYHYYTLELGGDPDGDGILGVFDNCPTAANPGQEDGDADGDGDACDNCPATSNADQSNIDGDAMGDACDPDDDGDGVPDGADNCPANSNGGQQDGDGDGRGDACDACPSTAQGATVDGSGCSQAQVDQDLDGYCDPGKGSSLCTGTDNCPSTGNPGQEDLDADGAGDICDPDDDNDTVPDLSDNCPTVANPSQTDTDGDGFGDACEPIDNVSVDTQEDGTPANTPTSIGSVEPCSRLNNNDILDADEDVADRIDIDVVVGPVGIPTNKSAIAFAFTLNYNPYAVSVVANDVHQLLSNFVFNGSDTVPDGDGSFYVAELAFTGERGPGVLARITIEAQNAAPSLSPLALANVEVVDEATGAPIDIYAINDGSVALDTFCGDAETDGDGIVDSLDNCDTVPNPLQEDMDGDMQGDVCDPDDDNDGYMDIAEGGMPLCGNGMNEDGAGGASDDGVADDGCPGGPPQAGAFSEAQFKIGTNPASGCGAGPEVGPSASWPADLAGSGTSTDRINLSDLASFVAPTKRLNTSPGSPGYDSRWDLILGGRISLNDLAALVAGPPGHPPMLGGARAFNGPACAGP